MNVDEKMTEILIVDDVPANLIAMEHVLRSLNVQLVTATGGYDALGLTLKHNFGLVLLDVQMPDLDGYQTAEMMQSAEHSKHIPIIFVTANSLEQENVLKGYASGAIDYITKPINSYILRSKVQLFVKLHKQHEQLKRLNHDLKIAQVEAEKANRLKTEFLANMSHELRTPMHAIMGFSELGVKNINKWGTQEKELGFKKIHASGQRLLSLLNNLLDLSKLEAETMDFLFHPRDLKALVFRVIESLKPLWQEKSLEMEIVETDIELLAEFDELKLEQVVTNFLSNAIKFSPDGGKIQIAFEQSLLTIAQGDGQDELLPALTLVVGDQGMGIPQEELGLVFDKFVQSSKTKNGSGGTGLGLAICKEIIKAHRGNIWAENNSTGGAIFKFSIPISQQGYSSEVMEGEA